MNSLLVEISRPAENIRVETLFRTQLDNFTSNRCTIISKRETRDCGSHVYTIYCINDENINKQQTMAGKLSQQVQISITNRNKIGQSTAILYIKIYENQGDEIL